MIAFEFEINVPALTVTLDPLDYNLYHIPKKYSTGKVNK